MPAQNLHPSTDLGKDAVFQLSCVDRSYTKRVQQLLSISLFARSIVLDGINFGHLDVSLLFSTIKGDVTTVKLASQMNCFAA